MASFTSLTQAISQVSVGNTNDLMNSSGVSMGEPNTPLVSPTGQTAYDDANQIMKLQRREPMTLEWVDHIDSTGTPITTSMTMYINPDNFSFQQAKVVGKQYTRAGIVYQIWGDDNATISLSGNTGLSSMKGIQQLEQVFYAGGTVLAYRPGGPTTLTVSSSTASSVDYTDNASVIGAALSTPDINTVQNISNTYANTQAGISTENLSSLTQYILSSYQSILNLNDILDQITNVVTAIMDWADQYQNQAGAYPSSQQFQQYALSQFNSIGGLDSGIIVDLAYQLTQDVYGVSNPSYMLGQSTLNSVTLTNQSSVSINSINNLANNITDYASAQLAQQVVNANDVQSMMSTMSNDNINGLSTYLSDIQQWNQAQQTYQHQLSEDILQQQILDLGNKWEPRKIAIYFEDRVYVGFFQNFQYQRSATNAPLVTYSMQFTVQYQFITNADANPAINNGNVQMYQIRIPNGPLVTDTTWEGAVNKAGGQWINHQWIPGHYINGTFVRGR